MSAPATSSRRVVRPARAHAPTMHPACRRQAGLTMRAAWDVCALGGNAAVADAVRTSLGPRGMDKMVKEPQTMTRTRVRARAGRVGPDESSAARTKTRTKAARTKTRTKTGRGGQKLEREAHGLCGPARSAVSGSP